MCGIFFSLSASEHVLPKEKTVTWLRNRGPDNHHVHRVQLSSCATDPGKVAAASETVYLTFVSTVLGLRGDHITSQPLVDPESRSVLCWNGEAWKVFGEAVQGNDTELVFQRLVEASKPSDDYHDDNKSRVGSASKTLVRLTNVINNITGPFSFVFYDGFHQRIFFSRDCLGRRSLLHSLDEDGTLRISSISDDGASSTPFEEIETDGLHMIDLSRMSIQDSVTGVARLPYRVEVIPWSHEETSTTPSLKNPIPLMNRALPTSQPPALTLSSPSIEQLENELRQSLETRIRDVPLVATESNAAKIAVLFSGGLDCTVLARLAHDTLPINEPIDLLNVSFENPRVAAALKAKSLKENTEMGSIYENCPDRITGRAGHAELQRVCPGRVWRFVAVDVPFTEFTLHREEVVQLMRPHNTEMDLSIACALYFASRGQGTIDSTEEAYTTTARVLLSGLGADELFAGYGRHGVSFSRSGFPSLIDEIDLDVGRLGKRNLGRDDRVMSNWGREARFPYLDEEFVSWATQTPVWQRCGFGTAKKLEDDDNDDAEEALDPEKKSLRLLALKLGMTQTAREKKRAIQFGSRTAKMESGRTKGTSII
jgi:asparagine synthetase B (glutamine-hydrolysing)